LLHRWKFKGWKAFSFRGPRTVWGSAPKPQFSQIRLLFDPHFSHVRGLYGSQGRDDAKADAKVTITRPWLSVFVYNSGSIGQHDLLTCRSFETANYLIRLRAKIRLDRFIQSPSDGENPNFAVFLTSVFGSTLGGKLNTGAELQTSSIYQYQNRCCTPTTSWRNQARKLWRSTAWLTDTQTDRQTDKNSTFLSTPAAGEIGVTPNLAWW